MIKNKCETRWEVLDRKYQDITSQLLFNRKINLSKKDEFLNPQYQKDLLDPFKINDMKKAVNLIGLARKNQQKIGIFADYDADGIPGAALLNKVFKQIGISCKTYIPSRSEGYGLNKKGIDELYEKGCRLLITIDLGITCKKEVLYAKEIGFEVIVTDHHEIQKEYFPNSAQAILHTHLSKNYNNKDLAGGALVFKLVQAIGIEFGKPNERDLKWLLDLPAISTICDVVPLTYENRVIAKYGLIVLEKTKNIGLQAIYEVAKIDYKNMDTYKVGYLIGPRINAPSRMKYENYAFKLLVSDDKKEAFDISKKLNDINILRQQTLKEALSESMEIINKKKLDKNKIIILKNKKWPLGILGLIASRITETYSRPSIVFTKEDGVYRGSARSCDYFNIMDFFIRFRKYLLGYGGHKVAGGLSLKEEKYVEFESIAIDYCNKTILKSNLVKMIKIECELTYNELSLITLKKIKAFEPFGLGNTNPIFLIKNAKVLDIKWLGSSKNHLKILLSFRDDEKNFEAIKFNATEYTKIIHKDDIIDIVFNLNENTWNGRTKVQLLIIDIKKSNEKNY
jgi:single-stranded-DNA-specific exonuclease